MTTSNKNIDNSEHDILKTLKPVYGKSKDDVWNAVFGTKLAKPERENVETKVFQLKWFKFAAAATIVMCICSTLFCKLYTTSIVANKGEHLVHELPGGSVVTLNAQSTLSYQPYWWSINRELSFEGEAFYEVEKGSSFIVNSLNGITKVLGTSFNISSRYDEYHVYCVTGKVKVMNPKSKSEVVITPNMRAILKKDLNFEVLDNVKVNMPQWRDNKFMFTAAPLNRVIQEVERQYNVEIVNEISLSGRLKYSGYFSKSQSVDETLNLICQSFGVSFVKQSNKKYIVSQN